MRKHRAFESCFAFVILLKFPDETRHWADYKKEKMASLHLIMSSSFRKNGAIQHSHDDLLEEARFVKSQKCIVTSCHHYCQSGSCDVDHSQMMGQAAGDVQQPVELSHCSEFFFYTYLIYTSR